MGGRVLAKALSATQKSKPFSNFLKTESYSLSISFILFCFSRVSNALVAPQRRSFLPFRHLVLLLAGPRLQKNFPAPTYARTYKQSSTPKTFSASTYARTYKKKTIHTHTTFNFPTYSFERNAPFHNISCSSAMLPFFLFDLQQTNIKTTRKRISILIALVRTRAQALFAFSPA